MNDLYLWSVKRWKFFVILWMSCTCCSRFKSIWAKYFIWRNLNIHFPEVHPFDRVTFSLNHRKQQIYCWIWIIFLELCKQDYIEFDRFTCVSYCFFPGFKLFESFFHAKTNKNVWCQMVPLCRWLCRNMFILKSVLSEMHFIREWRIIFSFSIFFVLIFRLWIEINESNKNKMVKMFGKDLVERFLWAPTHAYSHTLTGHLWAH